MKRTFGTAALAIALLGAPSARAEVLELYGSVRAGAIGGTGLNTLEMRSTDFFDATRGAAFGVEVGAEILFIDLFANFTQVVDGGGALGTLTQILAGLDIEASLDGGKKPRTFGRMGVAAGFALGTPAPVDPPLDEAQISDKGVVAQVTFALDYRLTSVLSIGAQLDGGYHYFFAGGAQAANDSTNQSKGLHVMAFLTFGLQLEAK